jgi:UDP-3-O-acyl N-acetylglucosamine deacetylase
MTPRQRTIRRPAAVTGVGFFTNADVAVCFLPAPPDAGVAFFRTDLPGRPAIPATIEHAVERHRRTALERDGACVELTEHVLAALAGLQIDNCRVEIDGPEPPGGDGSAKPFVDAILEAGIIEQDRPAHVVAVTERFELRLPDGSAGITAEPWDGCVVRYDLDYGAGSAVGAQSAEFGIDPDTFVGEIAGARTFILESEIAALRGLGYGKRVTSGDLLVFGETGVIGNRLRADNECARHKLLDCVGDFALVGGRLAGRFAASKTGHAANRELIRRLVAECRVAGRKAA